METEAAVEPLAHRNSKAYRAGKTRAQAQLVEEPQLSRPRGRIEAGVWRSSRPPIELALVSRSEELETVAAGKFTRPCSQARKVPGVAVRRLIRATRVEKTVEKWVHR